jgi:putative transcriptional regulator
MSDHNVPSLYEWVGGIDALNRLSTRFYEHVKSDSLLAPVFARMGADHPAHVAAFLAEVMGGPTKYSEQHGGQVHVVSSPVIEARKKTGLSQSQFAALMGVSVRTLQRWEQGRKQPSGAARTLLAIASTNPKAVLAVAGK